MKHTLARTAAAVAATALLAACGSGDDTTVAMSAGDPAGTTITIEDAWVRATTGTDDPSMTAAFMVIDNHGDTDVALVGAEADVAGTAELHEMAAVDGEMVMQQVDGGITITAGRGKVLQPGGYHVMLMGLTRELAPGDEVQLTLSFSDGSEQALTAPVKVFTEEEGHYHEPGSTDHAHTPDDPASAEGMDQ